MPNSQFQVVRRAQNFHHSATRRAVGYPDSWFGKWYKQGLESANQLARTADEIQLVKDPTKRSTQILGDLIQSDLHANTSLYRKLDAHIGPYLAEAYRNFSKLGRILFR